MNQALSEVVSSNEVAPLTFLTWLESPQIAATAKPGQFVMVRCGEDTLLRRPLSIHQVNETRRRLALLYCVVGNGTSWLSQRQAGEEIDILGPLGKGFEIYTASSNLLLVAGGMGIAPLFFLCYEATNKGHHVTFLVGVQSRNQLPEHIIKLPVLYVPTSEDGSIGKHGMITDYLAEYINGADQFFACGPVSMYHTLVNMPALKGKPFQISLEARMGCGTGVCYGCTIRTKHGLKQVCKDGPVFHLDDIVWDELITNL